MTEDASTPPSNKAFTRLALALMAIALVATISSLIAWQRQQDQKAKLPEPPLMALAAKHNIELGNFAISTYLDNQQYSNILSSQFNLALIDNTPNWYFTDGGLRPSPTTYNFKTMDKVVNYAQRHHMALQAHHLLWGEEKWLPDWLKNNQYTPAQLMDIIHQHIATVSGHYRGQIKEWTVVNEAFTRQQHVSGLHDWWADHLGGDQYIDQAFSWAHQADPQAKLIINDFDNEHFNPVSDAMYQYIKGAKARGIPIDGIGMQMHIDASHPPDKDEVIQNMQRFGALGVGVYVTEFDVNTSTLPVDDANRDKVAGAIYYNMTRACIESQVCHSFSILGITDKETWYNYMGPSSADSRPLPFDDKYQPKPAFWSLRDAFQQN
jgi:endo-1,4-beta-xylanase